MDLKDVKVRLSNYLQGNEDQDSFRKWLASALWDTNRLDAEVDEFLAQVEAEFAKCGLGWCTLPQMRKNLQSLSVRPREAVGYYYVAAGPWVFSSSANQPAVVEKPFQQVAGSSGTSPSVVFGSTSLLQR